MTVECIQGHEIRFTHGTDRLVVHLHRTLRLPEDGQTHALPPSLGHFPCKKIEDYREKVPSAWREHGGLFFPMWQREAMWLSFRAEGRPFAVKVAAGKVNAVSGQPWEEGLGSKEYGVRSGSGSGSGSGSEPYSLSPTPYSPSPDYLVTPPQPWLDGFNSVSTGGGSGKIRQFVAMPLGMGYTVEGQVTGKEDVGGLQLLAVPPQDGLLVPPPRPTFRGGQFLNATLGVKGLQHTPSDFDYSCSIGGASAGPQTLGSFDVNRSVRSKGAEMGLGQGGEMEQKIYPDPYGLESWLQSAGMRLFLHIVNSELYEQITGERPPKSPITAQTYANYGYPWYKLWDQEMGAVPACDTLAGVKTVGQKDQSHGFSGQQDDSPVHEKTVSAGQISPSMGIKEGKEW